MRDVRMKGFAERADVEEVGVTSAAMPEASSMIATAGRMCSKQPEIG